MRHSLLLETIFLGLLISSAQGFRGLRPVFDGLKSTVSRQLEASNATANSTIPQHSAASEVNHTGVHLLEHHHKPEPSAAPAPQPGHFHSRPHDHEAEEREREYLSKKLFGRIAEDFEPWKDGITLDMVERLYCTDYDRNFRFQIIKGEPYVVGEIPGFMEFNRMAKLLILEVISQYSIPDIDVVISTADECPWSGAFNGDARVCGRAAPLLAFDRGRDIQNQTCVPIPDHTFGSGGWPLAKIPSWKDAKLIFQQNEKDLLPWEDRNPHLFFRGAPTGSRLEIIDDPIMAGDERFDTRVTGWTGETRDEDYISLPAHCNYKYLMHMPGNGYSARLKYLLMCGSPVIFPYGGLEEFWYHLLEDGKNIKLIDWHKGAGEPMGQRIAESFTWLTEHPKEAQELARNAANMVHNVLTPDIGSRYLARVLIEYAKLQKFIPTLHQDATPFRMSAMGPDAHFNVNTRSCTYCKAAHRPSEQTETS